MPVAFLAHPSQVLLRAVSASLLPHSPINLISHSHTSFTTSFSVLFFWVCCPFDIIRPSYKRHFSLALQGKCTSFPCAHSTGSQEQSGVSRERPQTPRRWRNLSPCYHQPPYHMLDPAAKLMSIVPSSGTILCSLCWTLAVPAFY